MVFLLFLLFLLTAVQGSSPVGNWSELPPYIFAWYTGRNGWRHGEFPEDRFPGMNLIYSSWSLHHADLETIIAVSKNMSLAAQKKGAALVIGLYWSRKLDVNFSRTVHYGKQESWVPSPSDKRYWEEAVIKPARALANLSLHYPIYGVFWDLELYHEDHVEEPTYSWDQYSLNRFGEEKGIQIPKLNDSYRRNWMHEQGLIDEYKNWQEEKVYQYARETEQLVHQINPDFALGTLAYYDDWFDWAIRKGFDNERVPTLLWHEKTYSGYNVGNHPQLVQDAMDKIDSLGVNCLYFPGFWEYERAPEELLDDMQRALTNCNHFWIFHVHGFAEGFLMEGRSWDEYEFAFSFFEEYFFNSTGGFAFQNGPQVYPGINTRAYIDGNQAQLMLFKSNLIETATPTNITIHIDPQNQNTTWKNFSLVTQNPPNQNGTLQIPTHSLPIIIFNLTQKDLQLLEQGGKYQQIHRSYTLSQYLKLETNHTIPTILNSARKELQKGNPEQCHRELEQINENYIQELIDVATSYAQQAPPQEAPHAARYGLEQAQYYWNRGNQKTANKKLLNSLARLCQAKIPENWTPAMLLALLLVAGISDRWKKTS